MIIRAITHRLFIVTFLLTNCIYAQVNMQWPLISSAGKTVTLSGAQAGSVTASQMIPGTTFSAGTHNSDGFSCVNTVVWPTTATDGLHLDFPCQPNEESILSITGITVTIKLSGSSGNQVIAAAYRADNSGAWVNIGTPQEAVASTTTNITFGALNTELPPGHTYAIRLYTYAKNSGTSASRKVYVKNVTFNGTISAANTPVIQLSSATLQGFGKFAVGEHSLLQTYQVSGVRLTNNINITTQPSFEISLDSVNFSHTASIPHTGGVVSNVPVYVRFTPTVASGPIHTTINHNSSGASEKNISVSGIGLASQPTLVSQVSVSNVTGNSCKLTTSNGNGKNRIVIMRENAPVNFIPEDGNSFAGEDPNFAAAADLGQGNKLVFNKPDSVSRELVITNLSTFTRYYIAVYEYNGNTGAENYNPQAGMADTTTLKVPGLSAAPQTLNFGNVLVNTSSTVKSFTIDGKYLEPSSGIISLSAPQNFTIALSAQGTFSNQLSLPYQDATLSSTTIYVSFTPTLIQDYSASILAEGGNAATLPITVKGSGRDSASYYAKIIYVSPAGNDETGTGTEINPYKTVYKAGLKLGSGYTLILRGGVYLRDSLILREKALTNITVMPYPGEHPIIDGTSGIDCIVLFCSNSTIRGLEVMNFGHNGLWIMGHNNVIDNCSFHDGGDSGVKIGSHYTMEFPRNNLLTNCDSYRNYDSRGNGGNADGFSAKWNIGSGNRFSNCRAWENSDDGWDLWQADSTVIMDSCWCFRNGYDVWNNGSSGNGNGFKIGGAPVCVPHILRNCIAFDNKGASGGKGFDQNSNFAGHTMLNCLAFGNSYLDYNFYKPSTNGTLTAKNCVQYKGRTSPYIKFVDGDIKNNSWAALSWQTGYSWSGVSVTDNDFISVDTTLARLPRKADGTLQTTNLFRLKSSSNLVNKGVDVGLPFFGSAPDLGPYEIGLDPSSAEGSHQEIPAEFLLQQNFPNPFNPATMIQFSLPDAAFVKLSVFNQLGEQVAVLLQQEKPAGTHTVQFSAAHLPSGIYFYRLSAGEMQITKKMLLIK